MLTSIAHNPSSVSLPYFPSFLFSLLISLHYFPSLFPLLTFPPHCPFLLPILFSPDAQPRRIRTGFLRRVSVTGQPRNIPGQLQSRKSVLQGGLQRCSPCQLPCLWWVLGFLTRLQCGFGTTLKFFLLSHRGLKFFFCLGVEGIFFTKPIYYFFFWVFT